MHSIFIRKTQHNYIQYNGIYFNARKFHGMNFTRFRRWNLKLTKLKVAKYGFSYPRNRSENLMPWKSIAHYAFKSIRKYFRIKVKELFCFYVFDRDYFFNKQCNFCKKDTSNTSLIYFYFFFGFWKLIKKKRYFDPNEQNTKRKGGCWFDWVYLW